MENLGITFANPSTSYPVEQVLERRKKAVKLRIRTGNGSTEIWCPRKYLSLYRYHDRDRVVREAWIPDWLAEKAGLLH